MPLRLGREIIGMQRGVCNIGRTPASSQHFPQWQLLGCHSLPLRHVPGVALRMCAQHSADNQPLLLGSAACKPSSRQHPSFQPKLEHRKLHCAPT